MIPDHLMKYHEKEIPVLDQGAVRLVDLMGNDMTIVNAARISYSPEFDINRHLKNRSPKTDQKLLRYLLRKSHTSPFEMCEIVFYIRAPLTVVQQWIRHRTASLNQSSHRYSVALDSVQVTDPSAWRAQSEDNKQGSEGFVPNGEFLSQREKDLHTLAREIYNERLEQGVAKEQARKDLPHSTYTELVWKMDVHNLLHFLQLRMDPTAQIEIREYANAIASVVQQWIPWTWEAFEDYSINSMKLSRMEVDCMSQILKTFQIKKDVFETFAAQHLEGRELKEFLEKANRLLA